MYGCMFVCIHLYTNNFLDYFWRFFNCSHKLILLVRTWDVIPQPKGKAQIIYSRLLGRIFERKRKYHRSNWRRGLTHELSSPAQTLRSWVRIPFEALVSVCALFCVCDVLCVATGLATSWSPVQGILQTVYRIKKMVKRPRFNNGL
jgi:hypothetical protein